MLERAAAGLESSNLTFQRILPRPTRPSTSRRRPRLRAARAARSHQAARLISDGPRTGSADVHASSSSSQLSRTEAAPLFDFLFPKPTHALLRRQLPHLDSFDYFSQPARSTNVSRYSSLSTATRAEDPDPPPLRRRSKYPARSRWTAETIEPRPIYEHDDESATNTVDAAEKTAEQEEAESSSALDNRTASLPDLLENSEGGYYHDVWDAFIRLDPEEQDAFRPRVVQYLSKSTSVVESGRALSLFRQVAVEDWDQGFLSASILLLLRSNKHSLAVETFKKGLWERNLTGGFEYLLLDTVSQQQWSTLLYVWLEYSKKIAESDPSAIPDDTMLDPITSLQSLGALYFSLERFLAKSDWRVERWMDLNETSRSALRILRRKFANEALRQPCPPNQAKTILAFWRDHELYERYLWRMFDRWYRKTISTGIARMLPAIYEDWITLPDAIPSHDIMRGIFKVHYPHGTAALDQLYKDWVRYYGDLSHWGYEKFLKYYAYHGNKEKVQELWSRFREQFPREPHPRAFRSTMNVYAQAGDVEGAEQEMDRMINKYGVEPDISTWNTLLKTYVRANDYDQALSTFRSICETEQPDAFTYTHMMAIASKLGDLDQTIGLFSQAQQKGIAITKELCLSLVVAYCQNDQLHEAEGICLELAEAGVTSTTIWNVLIHYNGLHANLDKCYELLHGMKKYDLEWDHETVGSLLLALVRANQVASAYQIIRDALKNRLHIFQPKHLAIVMLGAVRTGDRQAAENIMSLVEKAPFSVPFNAIVAYTRSALEQAPNTSRTPELARQIIRSLQDVARNPNRDIRRLRKETQSLGQAIQLMVLFRDFAKVEELLGLFVDMFPEYREEKVLPQDIIASLMLAYHEDGSHEEVLELWRETWPRIRRQTAMKDAQVVNPASRYEVSRLVYRLCYTFHAMQDGEGLRQVVDEVVSAGFKFTSSTWNRVVRTLADLGEWETAMMWCETKLMHNWRGWNFNIRKLPLAERRQRLNSHRLEPHEETVLSLQKDWLKKRRLATWSASVEHKLAQVEGQCPLVLQAMITSDYNNMPESLVLPETMELDEAMMKLLTPLSLEDLRDMAEVLDKQLAAGESLADEEVLFRRQRGKDGEVALKRAELGIILSMLREKRQTYHRAATSGTKETKAGTAA